jgi:hypothetical protein
MEGFMGGAGLRQQKREMQAALKLAEKLRELAPARVGPIDVDGNDGGSEEPAMAEEGGEGGGGVVGLETWVDGFKSEAEELAEAPFGAVLLHTVVRDLEEEEEEEEEGNAVGRPAPAPPAPRCRRAHNTALSTAHGVRSR